MDLDSARKQIDAIDGEIVALLEERMELALRTGKLKQNISEPGREQRVIENVRRRSRGVMEPDFAEGLYRKVIAESARLQGMGLTLAGFQGERGAYSEAAALAWDPMAAPIPCKDFPLVFADVAAGHLDFGIVPVENSLEGAVTEVNDLLAETELKIAGEVTLPIRHCLLALPGADHRDLRVVYSHPQALAQCRGFIGRHKLEARPFYDTAGASKMLSRERIRSAGVIAGSPSAALYGLEVVSEGIGDHESNSTRFIVLSRTGATSPGDKCSLLFSLIHEAGALSSVMNIFSGAGLNLTRIESRPLKSLPGSYRFFLDFEGSHEDERVIRALQEVEKRTETYSFLGCYKGATP
jgi:prephenate dehydratase/chorismate mutase